MGDEYVHAAVKAFVQTLVLTPDRFNRRMQKRRTGTSRATALSYVQLMGHDVPERTATGSGILN
jgi:hypothetical protein